MVDNVVYQIKHSECSYGERYSYLREGLIFKTAEDAKKYMYKHGWITDKIMEITLIQYN